MAKGIKVAAVQLTWNGDELAARASGLLLDDALYEGAAVLLAAAQSRAPSRTGRLVRSGYAASFTRNNYSASSKTARRRLRVEHGQGMVAFAEFYARFMEEGTRRHRVRPKRAKALYLGKGRFLSRAQPRGVSAQHFVQQAYESSKTKIVEAFSAALEKGLEKG